MLLSGAGSRSRNRSRSRSRLDRLRNTDSKDMRGVSWMRCTYVAGTETESGLSSRLMGDPFDDTESSITSVSQIGRRRQERRLPQHNRVQQHLRYRYSVSCTVPCTGGDLCRPFRTTMQILSWFLAKWCQQMVVVSGTGTIHSFIVKKRFEFVQWFRTELQTNCVGILVLQWCEFEFFLCGSKSSFFY